MAFKALIRVSFVLLVFLVASSAVAQSQAPFLLKDTGGLSLSPSNPGAFNSNGYFYASDPVHGFELWITDGSTAGTHLLKDIVPGAQGSGIVYESVAFAGGYAYFFTSTLADNLQLWTSNFATGDTTFVKEICASCGGSSAFVPMTVMGGTLYFAYSNALWRSDGTEAGTMTVATFPSGLLFQSLTSITQFAGNMYFTANDGTHGYELWKSDGTATGTVMVADIRPGPASSGPLGLTDVGSALYFTATGPSGSGFWKTGGTAETTTLVAPLSIFFTGDRAFYGSGSSVYFIGDEGNGTNGLYLTDGVGTTLITSNVDAYGIPAVCGGVLLFGGADGHLLSADGTTVQDIKTIGPPGAAAINTPVCIGSQLFFTAEDDTHGNELWKSDGTTAGTALVRDIRPGHPSGILGPLTPYGSRVLFGGDNGSGAEPWSSDGTEAGTVLLKDVNPNGGNSVLQAFQATSPQHAIMRTLSIWTTDGTTPGTTVVAGGVYSGGTTQVAVVNGTYFFVARNINGVELWKSDGTPAGTGPVTDICPLQCDSSPRDLTVIGNTLYFSAYMFDETTFVEGRELWKTDGTEAGTVMVKQINSGSFLGGDPQSLINVGGTLYFSADDGVNGRRLWKSDGTQVGTVRVIGDGDSNPYFLTDVGGTLFFIGFDDLNGDQLRKTGGVTITTLPVPYSSPPFGQLVNFNGLAIFTTAAPDWQIWRSDGTAVGTVPVTSVNPGGFNPSQLTPASTAVYFVADDGSTGFELWKTDGISASLVQDLCPGSCSATYTGMAAAGASVFFQSYDPLAGEELWGSDGTAAHTQRVADIEPGTGGSAPRFLKGSGNLLFFGAQTVAGGFRPWVYCATNVSGFGVGAASVVVSGAAATFNVSPQDASNALVPCYIGTVHFTSDDPSATLPANYSFVAGEGPHAFSITLRTLGTRTVTVTDTITGSIVGSISVLVGASPVQSTITTSPGTIVANGVSTSQVTVRYKDANGVNLTTGGGTLALATSRGTISSPLDQGNGTYRATLTSSTIAGPATITGTLNGTTMTNTGIVQMIAGAATTFDVGAPSPVNANATFDVTLSALDIYGNTADAYGGTVHFSVNDSGATLPANYTFDPLDAGVHTFAGVSLKTVGNRTLSVADTANNSISGVALIAVKGPTTTGVTSNLNPSHLGASVTFTATVTTSALGGPPPGSVTFKDGAGTLGGATLSGGVATFSTSALARGAHAISAVYDGSTNFLTSTSPDLVQNVVFPAPAMTATFDPNPPGGIVLTWTADPLATHCEISRSVDHGAYIPFVVAPASDQTYRDLAVSPLKTYLYRVHFLDASASAGDDSLVDAATVMVFADDPLPADAHIMAAHAVDIRSAIDYFRAAAGLGVASYTNPIGPDAPVRALDWIEMRMRLQEARDAIPDLKPAAAYTHPALTEGVTPVSGADIVELRDRVK